MIEEVRLPDRVLRQLARHAQDAHPAEACGLLGGHRRGAVVELEAYLPQRNRAAHRTSAFAIDPLAFLRADRRLRDLGLDLSGVFHSHPGSTLQPGATDPSAADRALAWPGLLQLIGAFDRAGHGRVRVWHPGCWSPLGAYATRPDDSTGPGYLTRSTSSTSNTSTEFGGTEPPLPVAP